LLVQKIDEFFPTAAHIVHIISIVMPLQLNISLSQLSPEIDLKGASPINIEIFSILLGVIALLSHVTEVLQSDQSIKKVSLRMMR
jgi:hypothetical protein